MDKTPTDNPAVLLGRKRWAGVSTEARRAHMTGLAAKRAAIDPEKRRKIAVKASKAAAKARIAKAKAEKSSRRKSNGGKVVTTQSEK